VISLRLCQFLFIYAYFAKLNYRYGTGVRVLTRDLATLQVTRSL